MNKKLFFILLFFCFKAYADVGNCASIQKELNFYTIKCEKLAFTVNPDLLLQSKDVPAKFSGFFKINEEFFVVLSNGNLFNISKKIKFIKTILPNLNKSYFGGLLNLIYIENKNVLISYSLINERGENFLYLSVFDTHNNFKLISHYKLNDRNTVPSQLGGGMSVSDDFLYLQIGTADDAFISRQSAKSQNLNEIYGKIITIPLDPLIQKNELTYNILSYGHKHSQGLLKTKNNLLEVEHSIDGGDEINLIISDKNYGYNKYGYTKTVVNNKTIYLNNQSNLFREPIFYFSPSIAPSDIHECNFEPAAPSFAYLPCVFVSSLAQKSVFIIKFKRVNNSSQIPSNPIVISVEKIEIGERVRKIFPSDKSELYVLTDDMSIFKLNFVQK